MSDRWWAGCDPRASTPRTTTRCTPSLFLLLLLFPRTGMNRKDRFGCSRRRTEGSGDGTVGGAADVTPCSLCTLRSRSAARQGDLRYRLTCSDYQICGGRLGGAMAIRGRILSQHVLSGWDSLMSVRDARVKCRFVVVSVTVFDL